MRRVTRPLPSEKRVNADELCMGGNTEFARGENHVAGLVAEVAKRGVQLRRDRVRIHAYIQARSAQCSGPSPDAREELFVELHEKRRGEDVVQGKPGGIDVFE